MAHLAVYFVPSRERSKIVFERYEAERHLDSVPPREESLRAAIAPVVDQFVDSAVSEVEHYCGCVESKRYDQVERVLDERYGEQWERDIGDQVSAFSESERQRLNIDKSEAFGHSLGDSEYLRTVDDLRWRLERPKVDLEAELRAQYERRLRIEGSVAFADTDCEKCGGAGWTSSEMNTRAEWDYWSIGGRWSGCFDEGAWVDRAARGESNRTRTGDVTTVETLDRLLARDWYRWGPFGLVVEMANDDHLCFERGLAGAQPRGLRGVGSTHSTDRGQRASRACGCHAGLPFLIRRYPVPSGRRAGSRAGRADGERRDR